MKKTILTTVVLSSMTLGTQASTISLNFVRSSNGATALAPGDVAGVVAEDNWNNAPVATANNHSGLALVDGDNLLTTATASWVSGSASWSTAVAGTETAGNMAMMTGYLDQGGDGAGQIHVITINNIPYANYDVYLYHSSSGGPNRTARYQAGGIDIWTRNLAPANTLNGFVQAGYTNLTDAALAAGNPAGNYVLWSNLSGATLNIEGQGYGDADGGSGGNTRRAPVQGIQIVERIPEPGSALLLVLGGFATLIRRRR